MDGKGHISHLDCRNKVTWPSTLHLIVIHIPLNMTAVRSAAVWGKKTLGLFFFLMQQIVKSGILSDSTVGTAAQRM